jgi:hypothetical protein
MRPHRIRRQRWVVKAPTAESASLVKAQLRSLLDSVLLPSFNSAFDSLGVGDETVRIPRLKINLTLPQEQDFGAALTQVLRSKIDEALLEAIVTPASDSGIRRTPTHTSRRQILVHYLATGQIDWHATSSDSESLLVMLQKEADAYAIVAHTTIAAINEALDLRAAGCFRFLQLLNSSTRACLTEQFRATTIKSDKLPSTYAAALALLPAALRQLSGHGILGEYLLLRVQALLLAMRDDDLGRPLAPSIIGLLRECLTHGNVYTTQSVTLRTVLRVLTHMTPIRPTLEKSNDVLAKIGVFPDGQTTNPRQTHTVFQLLSVQHRPDQAYLENPCISTYDAGLVLLHPFLKQLFESVHIIEPGTSQISESELPRAAALLHWLLCGREEIFEFELTTIKLLLGLSPDCMLPVSSGLLSEVDCSEADNLLNTAISSWSALGKTSATGLRMSFLQRPGMFRDSANGWRLQIDPQAFDALLEHLPWKSDFVQLAWMPKPLLIEWSEQ